MGTFSVVVATGVLLGYGCTEPFESCVPTRTCPKSEAGGAGAGAAAGADSELTAGGSGGKSSPALGGSGTVTGGTASATGGKSSNDDSEVAGHGGEPENGPAGGAGWDGTGGVGGTEDFGGAAGSGGQADLIHHCTPNPCRNTASCIEITGGYRCECPNTYTGPDCELPRFEVIQGFPMDITPDGSKVVGYTKDDPYSDSLAARRAFRRASPTGLLTSLGLLPGGTYSQATSVNADGSVVVGNADTASGKVHAFRWSAEGSLVDLGVLEASGTSSARAVSADGKVVVGSASIAGKTRAFRWTVNSGMTDLGIVTGTDNCTAYDVSQDGTVIVGSCDTKAFTWEASTGKLDDLGLMSGCVSAQATAVNADGSVIAGTCTLPLPDGEMYVRRRAFQWTRRAGFQDLGVDGQIEADPSGLSRDGAVVVGTSGSLGLYAGFVWTAETGAQEPSDVLAQAGISTVGLESVDKTNKGLRSVNSVSADGKVIIGTTVGGGWVARLR